MKKVKWIALALVLCLGLIGGAYAAWTDYVEIDGRVSTGDIDTKFSSYGPNLYYLDAHNNVPVQDDSGVEYADVQYRDGQKKLRVRISNAYPWLSTLIKAEVTNHGSHDVALKDISFTPECVVGNLGFGLAQPYLRKLNVGIVSGMTEIGGVGVTLEEGLVLPAEGTMTFWLIAHALGDAEQNANYDFDIMFDWIQANMHDVDTGGW